MRFLRRLSWWWNRKARQAELDEEVRTHEVMLREELERSGIGADAASASRVAMGNTTFMREQARSVWIWPWVEGLFQDVRFAIRSLSRTPASTAAVVLTLGLGIGANTAIFSVVRGVLLKPLPHRDGARLMFLRQFTLTSDNVAFSVPEIDDLRRGSKALAGVAEFDPWTLTMVEGGEASRLSVGLVTGNYFSVMGLSPVLGRTFTAGDDGPGAAPVMMLTWEMWQRRFGGDSGIVGRLLHVNGKAVPVVGVLQSAPDFPRRMDILMNMVNSEHHLSATMVTNRIHRMTQAIARLTPTATVAQARAELRDIVARAHADHPEAYAAASQFQVTLMPLREVLGQKARLTLWLLMGAAGFVLIIACANVTNLTLIRGVRREHEMVVRAALGAGTARLRKLLLAENLILAALGGGLGLVLAFGGLGGLIAFARRMSPRAGEIRVDGVVLGFTMALTLVVAVLLSYLPGLSRENALSSTLASGGKRTAGLRRRRLQRALVVAQIAVSVVLLTGAGLLTRTLQRLDEVDTGLTGGNVLTLDLPADFFQPHDATVAYYERLQQQIAALPGVTGVGLGSTVPLRSGSMDFDLRVEGHEVAPGEPTPRAEFRTASPEYFRLAGIPLLQGREFASTDRSGTAQVVIFNKTAADRLFPGVNAIGRQVALTGALLKLSPFSDGWRTVVGVVGNTKDGGLDAEPAAVMFLPFAQAEVVLAGSMVVETAGDPGTQAGPITKAVRATAPGQPVEKVLTLDQIRDESVAPRRLNALLVASFGLLAVLIAMVGIAGVLAFSVSARTNEIGIRMTLGASAAKVQRMIMSEGGALVAMGLVLGLTGAVLLSGLIRGLLFNVAPNDPVTFLAVALVMAAVGIAACWIPAARAARIDPGIAIRTQ